MPKTRRRQNGPREQSKTLGDLEQSVLFALLHLEGDHPDRCYSLGIREEIERRTGRVISPGALYTVLDRLESHGMVDSSFGEPTERRGGRRKRLFRMTTGGALALHESAERFRKMSQGGLPRLRVLAGAAGEGTE